MGIFNNITGSGTNGAFVFKGSIAVAGDFPTSAEIQNGWTYSITADVVDNDPAKTNTGQSFKTGDIIAWNGTNWTDITGVEVGTWTNSLVTLSTETAAGTYSIDLSSYLPNDGAQYEVLISNAEVLSDTDPYNVYIASDIITNYLNLFVAKATMYETSSPFILPVGAGRTLSYKLDGNLVSNVGLKAFGYRKVR